MLGSYELRRRLGRGGFAEVWEAEHQEDGRRLALKVLVASLAASPHQLERFRQEGRIAASLNHPHSVYVFGAEEIDGYPTIAMELMPGGTLEDRLRSDGPMPAQEAVDRTLELIEGLEAAAEKGIVHRDIKPSNCFVDDRGRTLIGDFGLSKSLESQSDLTRTGTFLGTPAYSSPEQVRGREVDVRSDLYSLGATLYALLAGRPPFSAAQPGEVLARILSEDPIPFDDHSTQLPKGLKKVVLRLLAKQRAKRFSSYERLRAALLPYSSHALSAAGIAQRLVAYILDAAILWPINLVLGLLAWRGAGLDAVNDPLSMIGGYLPTFLYFAFCEKTWGRTAGKWLMALRVVDDSGLPLSWGRAVLRALVFGALQNWHLALMVAGVVPRPTSQPWDMSLLQALLPFAVFLLSLAAIASTMRQRNGWATLHDLISRTRVRFAPLRRKVEVPLQALETRDEDTPSWLGPFSARGRLWREGDESLWAAWDPVLERSVWVHQHSRAELEAGPAERPTGGLRRLQGRRDDVSWDAYAAPEGTALLSWSESSGKFGWGETRWILRALAGALDRSSPESEDPPLRLDHIWVDPSRSSLLLPFRAPGLVPATSGEATSEIGFLRSVARLCLEGRVEPTLAAGGGRIRAPVPERAETILELLSTASTPNHLNRIEIMLREDAALPATVTRLRRMIPLVVAALPLLFVSLMTAVLAFISLQPFYVDLQRGELAEDRLKLLHPARHGGVEADALYLLVARSYRVGEEQIAKWRGEEFYQQILQSAPEEARAIEIEAARRFPEPTADDAARAWRTALEYGMPDRHNAWARRGFGLLAVVASWITLPALLLAPLARGGPMLRLAGISLRLADGRRPSRAHCLLRTAVSWSPALLMPLTMDSYGLVQRGLPFLVLPLEVRVWMTCALLLVLILGSIHSVLRPQRGLADRLVGTVLVPK